MPDTTQLRLHPFPSGPGKGEVGGPEGGDDDRAATGGPAGTRANRCHGGRGVSPPRDLPGDLLPVPPALPPRRPRRPRGSVPEASHLTRPNGGGARGADLPDAQGSPEVGSPADPGRALPPRRRTPG